MVNFIEYSDFNNNLGKRVKIKGKIAENIWQHMTTIVNSHMNMEYFDLDDDPQIVIYSKGPISCKGTIELTGKVIKLEGKSKNPKYKINDEFYEFQMIVDSWKCI
ncbi:hypothetical protein LCGC14_0640410 [marine sediment metagenome]|uniref:Uncharacterized protein n=1 Tax=marine sediment metagenome TaxID=412755 RepID=A0A0F9RIQ3_9ZZZZ